jgi:Mn-dependent DtxR family transcriptional regulator
LLYVLKFIYEKNNIGIKPSYIDIGRELGLSQPTVRNRLRFLISNLYLIESLKGKKKLVELTERGKGVF